MKNLLIHGLRDAGNLFFDTVIHKFVTSAKSTAKADLKKISTLKEADFNKLKAEAK